MLQGSFAVGDEVKEQLLKYLCLSLQSPAVKQTAVEAVADIHRGFSGLFKHHAEKKNAKQSPCQDTIVFHAVDNGEGSE